MIIQKILNIDDYYYDVFMSISEAITGFPSHELQSTGLGEDYYKYVLGSMEAATFVEFLNISKAILASSTSENQLKDAIAAQVANDSALKDITDKVIKLWYLGTWGNAYINDRSYAEGLVWKIMGSHPPGAKQPGFKSWSFKPINS